MDYLKLITTPGLAVDIDETLSWTIGFWVASMQEKFGNPEQLTVKEMVEKYRYTQNVPYWQHEEALAWIDEKINSNATQEEIPLIEGSSAYLNRINEIVPVAAYITARPVKVSTGTKNWLRQHNFPDAPLICRPDEIMHSAGNEWKAEVLKTLYPRVLGIIDDNAQLLQCLGTDYPGRVFLYDHHDNLGYSYVAACKDWLQVYTAVQAWAQLINDQTTE